MNFILVSKHITYIALQALYLALVNNVDYQTEFGCKDELKVFHEFMKNNGGLMNRAVTINKKSIKTSWMPLSYFEPELRKKLIKLVRESSRLYKNQKQHKFFNCFSVLIMAKTLT